MSQLRCEILKLKEWYLTDPRCFGERVKDVWNTVYDDYVFRNTFYSALATVLNVSPYRSFIRDCDRPEFKHEKALEVLDEWTRRVS